jgi:hypothetical protein
MYRAASTLKIENKITEDQANLIKLFITSNSPITLLRNPYLRRLVAPSIEIPGVFSFRYHILPTVFGKMINQIQEKCTQAVSIVLIADGWTNRQNSEYLGLFNNKSFLFLISKYKWSKYLKVWAQC